jgi:hypothetical protein
LRLFVRGGRWLLVLLPGDAIAVEHIVLGLDAALDRVEMFVEAMAVGGANRVGDGDDEAEDARLELVLRTMGVVAVALDPRVDDACLEALLVFQPEMKGERPEGAGIPVARRIGILGRR